MSHSFIWPKERIVSSATSSGQIGPGSDDIKVILNILQISYII